MFPKINHINDILPFISDKPEIRIFEHTDVMPGYKTICYTISGHDTFNNEHALECRGITFFPNGKIAARTMHKFFNINEKAFTQESELDFSKVSRIMDKRDGSMLHPVPTPDKSNFVMKSKKSFESEVAIAANAFVSDKQNYIDFIKECIHRCVTPIFEFTSPKHRIVLNYQNEALVLLHIRHNISGEYFFEDELKEFAKDYNIPVVDGIDETYEEIKQSLADKENIEGYVIQFENGDMVKLKTPKYIEMHHVVTFVTERAVAEMVLNETLDDLLQYLKVCNADISKVIAINAKLLDKIIEITDETERLYLACISEYGNDRKAIAINMKEHKYFSLLMQRFSGKEPDYKKYYVNNHLKEDFSLDQI